MQDVPGTKLRSDKARVEKQAAESKLFPSVKHVSPKALRTEREDYLTSTYHKAPSA
jgi:hypothetical protein